MLSIARLLFGLVLSGSLISAVVMAEETGVPPQGGTGSDASSGRDGGLFTGVAVFSHDEEYRTLLIDWDQNKVVNSIVFSVFENSPLDTDMYLGVEQIRPNEVEYQLGSPRDGYRIVQVLAIPSGDVHDADMIKARAGWQMEIPSGMHNSAYFQDEWSWPAKHSGVVLLVEYEQKKWGFVEMSKPGPGVMTQVSFYEFMSPLPMDSADLAYQIRRDGKWPKAKRLKTSKYSPKEYRGDYYRQALTREYLYDANMVSLHDSDRYREIYSLFTRKKAKNEVVDLFGKLLKFAANDYGKALLADPSLREVTANAKRADVISHWAVFHFLSIASQSNLNLLWENFKEEIITVIAKDPESLAPQFYSKFVKVSNQDPHQKVVITDRFLSDFSPNSPFATEAFVDMEVVYREWMINSPETLYRSVVDVQPSSPFYNFLKDVLATVPVNEVDSRVLGWIVDLAQRKNHEFDSSSSTDAKTLLRQRRRTNGDLALIRDEQPNLWRAAHASGFGTLDASCRGILEKLDLAI